MPSSIVENGETLMALPNIIPLPEACESYFRHLSPAQLEKKIVAGDIALPLVVLDPKSQKSAKGVMADDLEKYVRARHADAVKDMKQLLGN